MEDGLSIYTTCKVTKLQGFEIKGSPCDHLNHFQQTDMNLSVFTRLAHV